jgi:hypothetical protein
MSFKLRLQMAVASGAVVLALLSPVPASATHIDCALTTVFPIALIDGFTGDRTFYARATAGCNQETGLTVTAWLSVSTDGIPGFPSRATTNDCVGTFCGVTTTPGDCCYSSLTWAHAKGGVLWDNGHGQTQSQTSLWVCQQF